MAEMLLTRIWCHYHQTVNNPFLCTLSKQSLSIAFQTFSKQSVNIPGASNSLSRLTNSFILVTLKTPQGCTLQGGDIFQDTFASFLTKLWCQELSVHYELHWLRQSSFIITILIWYKSPYGVYILLFSFCVNRVPSLLHWLLFLKVSECV